MISESKLSILRCPVCKKDLCQEQNYLVCTDCHTKFPVIDNIVVFLTRDDLTNFLGEAWGSELKKENHGNFASNEDTPDYLESICKDAAKTVNRSRWLATAPGLSESERKKAEEATWPFIDLDMPEEAKKAIAKSRERVVELSRASSAKRVLDWPTGPGYCLHYLANHVSPQTLVVALDVNFGMLARRKIYFDEYGLSDNVLLVAADARNMPFVDNTFSSVTVWGGTIEIENAEAGFKETHRVLESGGWVGVSGDQYSENSASIEICKKLGLYSLATRNRLESTMKRIGFNNLEYEILFEGYDMDLDTPDEDRCPLPARGDWYQHIAASVQK
ncbi:methyltransferase domain-containing protein [bacterium]|nr:methyltransferase domain-containing protein [bacterium]